MDQRYWAVHFIETGVMIGTFMDVLFAKKYASNCCTGNYQIVEVNLPVGDIGCMRKIDRVAGEP